jgi:hypothetical protein
MMWLKIFYESFLQHKDKDTKTISSNTLISPPILKMRNEKAL